MPLKMRTRPSALAAPLTVPVAVLICAFDTLAARTIITATMARDRNEIGMARDHTNRAMRSTCSDVEAGEHADPGSRLRRGHREVEWDVQSARLERDAGGQHQPDAKRR